MFKWVTKFPKQAFTVAANEEELTDLIRLVRMISEDLGLFINVGKTKVMVVDRAGHLPESEALNEFEKVNSFMYLGSLVDADGGSAKEIRRRIALGKAAMPRLRKVTTDWKISITTRKETN